MKKILQSMTLIVALCFAFSSTGFAQEILLQQTGGAAVEAPADRDEHGEWIYWDSGENNGNSIGTDAAAEFSIAHRWMPADLDDYDGMDIVTIRFFPRYQDATYTVKIWSGAAGNEVYSQEVDEFTNEDWNEIELEDAYEIDASEDLWYGIHIDTQGGFPAGCDDGPEVGGKGNMMIWQGDWVELTDLNDELTYNWNLGAYVLTGDDDENGDDPETYEITFNVDMSTAEGFDPDAHSVFVTGSFADWAEPGTEGSLELEWAGKARTAETIMYENFDDGIPEEWLNLDENGDGYTWKLTGAGHAPYDGDNAVYSESWDGSPLEPDNWLITHQLNNVTDDWELSFFVKSQDPDWAAENYDVLISTTGTDTGDFTSIYNDVLEDDEWEQVTLSLADYAGEDIYIAFRHHDVTDMFQILIDAIQVEGTPGEDDNGDDPEELIYTGMAHAEAGTMEYKYFSDVVGDGWEGGEWEGDPNREVEIDGDTVLHDVWTEYDDVSIVDAELLELNIYPNPASSVINVETDSHMQQIKVFDVSGRMVMHMDVQNSQHTFDVSSLSNGFYIMQVHTEDGVEGRRFHVAK